MVSDVRPCNCWSWKEQGLVLRDIGRCSILANARVGGGLSKGEGSEGGGGLKVSSAGGGRREGRCETDGLDIA